MTLRDYVGIAGLRMLLEKQPQVEGKQSVWVAEEPGWVNRKTLWRKLGLRGTEGRDAAAYQEDANNDGGKKAGFDNATSAFDPVLCELVLQKLPRHAQVIDPFAGGSTRGIVASVKGLQYWGCDLSIKQIEANEEQAIDDRLGEHSPVWVCGDSLELMGRAPMADMLLGCPPYYDLEQYEGGPQDLSMMATYEKFLEAYTEIVLRSCRRVKPDGQACFVVGNFRDKKGDLRYFTGDTVNVFAKAGFALVDEVILVTVPGKRANAAGRVKRTVRRHQTVLFFENRNR